MISFYLCLVKFYCEYICNIFFNHLYGDAYLGLFSFLSIVKNNSNQYRYQVPHVYVLTLYPKSDITGPLVVFYLAFKDSHTDFDNDRLTEKKKEGYRYYRIKG